MRFIAMYVQLEVDEFGHSKNHCVDEDLRLELIAADVQLPGIVVRVNPDLPGFDCFRRVQLRNGEIAWNAVPRHFTLLMDRVEAVIRSSLLAPPASVCRIFVDSHSQHEPSQERLW
jgi:hypothetical protein